MNIPVDSIWPALLRCRKSLNSTEESDCRGWTFEQTNEAGWSFRMNDGPVDPSVSDDCICLDLEKPYPESCDKIGLAGIYLRLLHGLARARHENRFFITAHFAQSIDGRIATHCGDSQWIGNKANLIHAHRLRALHDGILVGANTVRRDRPNLTVRHCDGRNPVRVVLAGRRTIDEEAFSGLSGDTPTWVLSTLSRDGGSAKGVEWITLAGSPSAHIINVSEIIRCLRQRGLQSLMIEGGSYTVSQFLAAGEVNELEIHVAPIVLGSGISSLNLPEIDRLRDAPQFKVRQLTLDGEHLYCLSPE
jgi:diaminohydroxyphosphoribosylaminopyrimidine deaminase/5-amino-6-(5-phosphoribosylamino)uracil reductase